jgi:hypothetical protein
MQQNLAREVSFIVVPGTGRVGHIALKSASLQAFFVAPQRKFRLNFRHNFNRNFY